VKGLSLNQKLKILWLLMGSLALTVILIAAIQAVSPPYFANMLLGLNAKSYPLTFQTVMWFPFAVGCVALCVRWLFVESNQKKLQNIWKVFDLAEISETFDFSLARRKLEALNDSKSFVAVFWDRVYTTIYDSTRFNDIKSDLQSAEEELFAKVDSSYAKIRYIAWLLPTLGFMGTVYGISSAVSLFGGIANAEGLEGFTVITSELAIAFDTTLLSLIQSSILIFFLTLIEEYEASTIIKSKTKVLKDARKLMRDYNKYRSANQKNNDSTSMKLGA